MTSTIHEAKTNLSKLIQKALAGEEVIIANRNKPVVKLVAIEEEKSKRKIGIGKHLGIIIPDDIDKPLPDEVITEFYNDNLFPPLVTEDETNYEEKK